MIIDWVFMGITLSAALMATFVGFMRRAILALWVAGLGVGAIYLTMGAEFLAIIQWIVSTLVALSFVFFAVMFGEYNVAEQRNSRNWIVLTVLSIILGCGFTAVIGLGSKYMPELSIAQVPQGSDLVAVGKILTRENLLSLEILALTLFLVLLGGGVVARSDSEGNNSP